MLAQLPLELPCRFGAHGLQQRRRRRTASAHAPASLNSSGGGDYQKERRLSS